MEDKFQLKVSLNKVYSYEVEVYHQSSQVLRFHLKCGVQEMNLEKRLLEKRQPWKVLSANFLFTSPEAARNFNIICQCLEDAIKEPRAPYIHPKNYYL